jgi:hypothetical protein
MCILNCHYILYAIESYGLLVMNIVLSHVSVLLNKVSSLL